MDAMPHREIHERVVGGMEPHFVDPPPEAVEGDEFRGMPVRELAPFEYLFAPDRLTQGGEGRVHPIAAFPQRGFPQHGVGQVQVAGRELRRLVRHLMGGETGAGCVTRHGTYFHPHPRRVGTYRS